MPLSECAANVLVPQASYRIVVPRVQRLMQAGHLGTVYDCVSSKLRQVPMRVVAGQQATVELRGLRRSARQRAKWERPAPSSLPTPEPLPLPGADLLKLGRCLESQRAGW